MSSPFFVNVKQRRRQAELMDQATLDEQTHRAALRGLKSINQISRSAAILWPTLKKLALSLHRPLRVLDVGCGGGDIVIGLTGKAAAAGLKMEIDGCDLSSVALKYAQNQAVDRGFRPDLAKNLPIARDTDCCPRFFQCNAITGPLPEDYDVLMCSLFLHHFDEQDAIVLLSNLAAAAQRVLINDLVRSQLGYLLAWVGTRALTRSHVVHIDGPLSVAGAFTPSEALKLAEQAGLTGATLTRHWPQRYLLAWSKT